MKKTLLLIFCFPILLMAQNKEGKVFYKETIQLNINVEGLSAEMMKMMPKSQSSHQVLYFNDKESVYKNADEQENEGFQTGSEESGTMVQVKFAVPDNRFYKNLAEQKIINQKEFFSRKFLINSKLENKKWKFTGQQKKVLGYLCQQATTTINDTVLVKAWFTPQIPVANGPQEFGGLPGLILELNINDGERTIVAEKVLLEKLEKGTIVAPKKGKKMTQEAFEKMQEEKLKEMDGGGVSTTTIKIRSN